jgi:cysteine desulfurase/selenocysteine lyase
MIAQSLIDSKILQAGDHIILSVAEHHANIVPRQLLARKYGIVIDRLNLDINLQFDLAHLKSILTDRTKVVSVTACSNVLGIAYDLRPVRKMI